MRQSDERKWMWSQQSPESRQKPCFRRIEVKVKTVTGKEKRRQSSHTTCYVEPKGDQEYQTSKARVRGHRVPRKGPDLHGWKGKTSWARTCYEKNS